MKRRYIKETWQITKTYNWQIINTFVRIRTLDQQFNIAADYTADKNCYKLLKLTSLPTVI